MLNANRLLLLCHLANNKRRRILAYIAVRSSCRWSHTISLRIRIRDPVLFNFWVQIRDNFFPDPESRIQDSTDIFWELNINFVGKKCLNSLQLNQIFFCTSICSKKVRQLIYFPLLFLLLFDPRSGIRYPRSGTEIWDPGYKKIQTRDKKPRIHNAAYTYTNRSSWAQNL